MQWDAQTSDVLSAEFTCNGRLPFDRKPAEVLGSLSSRPWFVLNGRRLTQPAGFLCALSSEDAVEKIFGKYTRKPSAKHETVLVLFCPF